MDGRIFRFRGAVAFIAIGVIMALSTGSPIHSDQLTPRPNQITNVYFVTSSPSTLNKGTPIVIQFNYEIPYPDGAIIQAVPLSNGQAVPYTSVSPVLQPGKGIRVRRQTTPNDAPIVIDGVELSIVPASGGRKLFSQVYPCHFEYVDPVDIAEVTKLDVAVSPPSYTGPCPHKFTFTGNITSSRSGWVKYRWVRSDGVQSAVHSILFRQAGTKPVEIFEWTLSNSGSRWARIEIVEGTIIGLLAMPSANFTLNCQ